MRTQPGSRSQNIFVQLRVWERHAGDTYPEAVANGSASGRSAMFSATARATIENGLPGLPPKTANGFAAFPVSTGPEVPLRVARIQSSTGGAEVFFATYPGRSYCVKTARACGESMNWTILPGAERIEGTGHVAKVVDAPSAGQHFYRVYRLP